MAKTAASHISKIFFIIFLAYCLFKYLFIIYKYNIVLSDEYPL